MKHHNNQDIEHASGHFLHFPFIAGNHQDIMQVGIKNKTYKD